jgi:hypothetical protein
VTQRVRPTLERFIIIRKGPVFWEWRHRDENAVKYRTTKIPSSIAPKDALDMVCHDYLQLNPNVLLTGGWELTDGEKEAGKKGMNDSEVDRLLKGREH